MTKKFEEKTPTVKVGFHFAKIKPEFIQSPTTPKITALGFFFRSVFISPNQKRHIDRNILLK